MGIYFLKPNTLVILSQHKRKQDLPYQHIGYVHLMYLYIIITICNTSSQGELVKRLPMRTNLKHTLLKCNSCQSLL